MPVILLELIIPLISQLVEQLACIQKVPGSIPGLVIIQFYHMYDDKMRTNTAIKAGTKQRILALKEEIQALKSGVLKTKSINSWVNQGCGIWCLVSLLDSISDMVAEHNWQIYEQGDEEDLVQPQDYSENEYDWSNAIIKEQICDHHPKYLVTAKLWPTFMYVDYKYNPEDNEKGLFQSTLLLRLCFALSSVGSWRVEGGDFNYQQFYNNIPNFFKMPPGPTSKAKI
ncbi:hypothetical protein SERLA73DRAFT_149321 [Serpula lacrymans var. lacrymans S7.3]|uniref:Uncharacterized protein n=1 Tax=Serpula lacrymans var. lacrymans (strain S7.3) TaxID=936435 RepID=F8PHP7_SERL3|nr:hypothetical protein SERLA73DRAFT_149321 [Serpula lacrymans var. lacrymans S7.3]